MSFGRNALGSATRVLAGRTSTMHRSTLFAIVLSSLGLLTALPFFGQAPDPPGDPIEGLWSGQVGSEREKVEVGLDFRRDEQGVLRLFLTQPISSYYGVAAGEAKRQGDTVVVDEILLSLRIAEGRLVGTYPGPNSPAEFRRTEAIAAAPPIPDLPAGPEPAWQTRLNGQIFASPAVYDDKVYLGTTGGVFNALDARDGKILWSFAAGRPIFGAALATSDAVYFVCDNGYLFRLGRQDGKEVWRYDLGDSVQTGDIGNT